MATTSNLKVASPKKLVLKKGAAKKSATSKATATKPVAKKSVAKESVKKSVTRTATNKRALATKVAAEKAPARKPAAREVVARALRDYDPRRQLDKLTETRQVVSRGLEVAPSIDVDAVLGEFFGLRKDEPLTLELATLAAQDLGVEVAALRAIAQVESGGAGFDAKGRPTILYERHVFARNTAPKGKFNAQYADISSADPYPKGGFGNNDQQWVKLARAYQLDPEAALKAPSWGMFQILGENHRASGFPDVRSFVTEMFTSPAGHLRALVGFIKANPLIHQGLKKRDWVAVAKGYNGSGYKTYDYDNKLATAYAKFAGG